MSCIHISKTNPGGEEIDIENFKLKVRDFCQSIDDKLIVNNIFEYDQFNDECYFQNHIEALDMIQKLELAEKVRGKGEVKIIRTGREQC